MPAKAAEEVIRRVNEKFELKEYRRQGCKSTTAVRSCEEYDTSSLGANFVCRSTIRKRYYLSRS